jgi:hypothetical protein
MRSSSLLKITEINTFDEFLGLRSVWNGILARSRDNNIFLTWEYLSTFWKHFGKNAKLRILLIKDENEIIAIAPLRQSRFGFADLLGYNVIEPLGYRGLMPEGGDYTSLILGEKESECLHLILKYLIEHHNWDFIYMYDIPETSIIPNLLPHISKVLPITYETIKGTICPYITLPDSLDVFLKGLPRKFRKELGRCMRNLQKDFRKVELKRYDELGSVEETMKIHFNLNKKRWASKQMSGTFKTKEICAFYIDIAKLFADKGWLALHFLVVNDEPVAGLYCFEYNQTMYAAVSGFDPYYSKYSIGNLLFLKVIEKCIKRKMKEFDFMKGAEPYKFGWTKEYRRNWNIKFVNKRVKSHLYNLGIKILKQAHVDKTSLKRGR